MPGPLEGTRVVDAASYVTGPWAAMILGDLGADVVKVEPPPRGDPFRNFGQRHHGTSIWFANVNRSKRSVMLDLKGDGDRAAFVALLRRSDVLVQNWRPGVAESLGVGDEVVADANPALVRLAVTGYGPTGPLARRPAFDTLLQGHSGLASAQGDLVRTIVADKTTALIGAQAVLAALVARGRHGGGERIDLAMLDVMGYFNFPDVFQDHTFLTDGGDDIAFSGRRGRSGVIETKDGKLLIAPVSGAQIGRALDAVGHPEWKEELKAITDPVVLAETMLDRVESVTRGDTTEHWVARFAEHDVPAGPVLALDEHLNDPQVVNNEVYGEYVDPELGRMRRVRYPGRFRSGLSEPAGPVPRAGQHTDEVITELGLSGGMGGRARP